MSILTAAAYGALGAFIVYLAIFRTQRLEIFIKAPNREWLVLVFDFGIYLVLGAVVTAFLINPTSVKEAILAGGTWEGVIGGLMPTREE